MSETEALFAPVALMRDTPDVYDVDEIISWTWAIVTFKMWFQAPSHIYSNMKVNSYLKICG